MELKSSITAILLLFLLATPCISRGESDVVDSENYEIDYRGPETHSSILPPPGHSHGRRWINRESARVSPKIKGSRGVNIDGDSVKKIHG